MTKYNCNLLDESYVAHYTKAATAKEILRNNKLKISTAGEVNDPYENQITWFEDDASTNSPNYLNDREIIKNQLKNYIKLLCTTKNDLSGDNLSLIEMGMKNPYYAIPSMWAHYGENHQGICLIFDKNLLSQAFEFEEISFKSYDMVYIDYLSHIATDTDRAILAELKSNAIELKNHCWNSIKTTFSQKNTCWAAEQEYRWLVFKETDEDLFLNYQDSLKGIVLGADFNFENEYDEIESLVPDIVYGLTFEFGRYQIDKIK